MLFSNLDFSKNFNSLARQIGQQPSGQTTILRKLNDQDKPEGFHFQPICQSGWLSLSNLFSSQFANHCDALTGGMG